MKEIGRKLFWWSCLEPLFCKLEQPELSSIHLKYLLGGGILNKIVRLQ